MDNQQIITVEQVDYDRLFIDEKNATLWIWNEFTKMLSKHTKDASTEIGKLETGRGTSFLHADAEDRLYFVDIPF